MSGMKLPSAMAELRPHLKELVSEGKFTVLLASRGGLNVMVDNNEEGMEEFLPTAGTVLSAFDGVTRHERALGGFRLEDVRKAAGEFMRDMRFGKDKSPDSEMLRRDFVTPMEIDPMEIPAQEKLEQCRELHRRLKDRDARIVNVQVRYLEMNEHSVFASRAADLAQRVQRVRNMIFVAVAGLDGQVRYDFESKAGGAGWERLSWSDEELERVVKGAVDLLGAERIEPGEYRVITAPGVSGVVCHESFGHGVETDMFLKERAQAAHFINKRVGSELVDIFDDPSQAGGFGSYFFDDEGQISSRTQIVEKGIFRRGITDLYSATALGIPRSANGRRQDYSRKAYARMSNTYFGPGTSSLEEMLAQVDEGVYLDKWYSGMEDPLGWGIQVTCRYGHEIKGGRITGRVFAPVGISGYVPEVLGSISAVSSEVEMDAGGCGKGHKEYVPVTSGGPHLLMKARLG